MSLIYHSPPFDSLVPLLVLHDAVAFQVEFDKLLDGMSFQIDGGIG